MISNELIPLFYKQSLEGNVNVSKVLDLVADVRNLNWYLKNGVKSEPSSYTQKILQIYETTLKNENSTLKAVAQNIKKAFGDIVAQAMIESIS